MKAVALFKFPQSFHKISTNFKPQKLKPNSILKLQRIWCASQAELSRLEKLFNDTSGECFFVYYASNFTIFPQCFDKLIWFLDACKNSGSVKIVNVFQAALMLLRVTALYSIYHFVCQEAKIS